MDERTNASANAREARQNARKDPNAGANAPVRAHSEADIPSLLASRLPFWLDLTQREQQALIAHTRPAHFRSGERVRRSDEPTGVILVLEGCLRSYMLSDEGKEITLFRIESKESCVLAASCALSMITFDVFLDAIEDTSALVIDSEFFAKLIEQNVWVEAFTYRQTAERFSDVMWVMEQILFMSFDERLAVFLLDESARTKSMALSLTHDEIARHLCSAREVVSRMLKRFAEEGLVSIARGTVEIADKPRLLALASRRSNRN